MRIPTTSSRRGLGFDMTPMIDVVFNLIIFFLLSSHLARREVQMQLDLPTATTSEQGRETETRRVVLQVSPDGAVSLGGKSVELTQLVERLQRERAASEELEVRIRADRNVPFQYVEPILKACAQLGIWDVSFAVTRKVAP